MGFLETLRRWVDGDEGEDALSRAATEQAKPRRQAEEFIAQIARSIGAVMQSEAVPMPPDQTVIPPEYIVFLSNEDDRDWQGIKRRALEQGLYHVLAEHARELAGRTKLATTSFTVELRVDGTLQKGEVRVQHSWEESSSSNKTSITPRRRNSAPLIQPVSAQTTPSQNQPVQTSSVQLNQSTQSTHQLQPSAQSAPNFGGTSQQLAPTMLGAEVNAPTITNETTDDATRVTPRSSSATPATSTDESTRVAPRELYRLEIWRDNRRQSVIPIFQEEISIGRKSNKVVSDVQLEGDPEVSRPHAVLRRLSNGKFFITHKGKNPTLINGQEAPIEQPILVAPGESITIGSFLLRIQGQ